MPEPLEASVTLEEIFTVVGSKRVPLAPELAGYLALEIAETPAARDGDVDPKQVYVGEEGTVALVPRGRMETPAIPKHRFVRFSPGCSRLGDRRRLRLAQPPRKRAARASSPSSKSSKPRSFRSTAEPVAGRSRVSHAK